MDKNMSKKVDELVQAASALPGGRRTGWAVAVGGGLLLVVLLAFWMFGGTTYKPGDACPGKPPGYRVRNGGGEGEAEAGAGRLFGEGQ
jgi:hypothetical protein